MLEPVIYRPSRNIKIFRRLSTAYFFNFSKYSAAICMISSKSHRFIWIYGIHGSPKSCYITLASTLAKRVRKPPCAASDTHRPELF